MKPDSPLFSAGVIGLYFAFLLVIGYVFKRLNRSDDDYFRAGMRGSWWMVGMSLYMSSISTQTFIANAGVAFNAGASIYGLYIVNSICYLLLAMGIAAWYRQARVTTFAEIMRERYNASLQQFFTYFQVAWLLISGGVGLFMLTLFIHGAFGLPMLPTVCAIGFIIVVYTVMGGNWAVMATDFIQSLLLFAMAVLLAVLSWLHVGGWEGFSSLLTERGLTRDFAFFSSDHPSGLYSPEWLAGAAIVQVYAILGMGGGQRFFSCKDGREARRAAMLCAVVGLVGTAFFFIPPMVARLMHEEAVLAMGSASPADLSYVFMSLKLLPLGFLPLMAVAMLSAQLSSLDTSLNANAAVFLKNAYPALMRAFGREPIQDHQKLLWMGRVLTIAMGVTLTASAIYFMKNAGEQGIFELTFRLHSVISVPLMIPLFIGMFIRHTPPWSGWVALVAAAAASTFGSLQGMTSFEIAFLNTAVGIGAFAATVLWWPNTSESDRKPIVAFFTRLHTPVNFASEVGEANDLLQRRLIGRLTACLGGFVLLFLLFPNSASDRLSILAVAIGILLIASLLLLSGRQPRFPNVSENQSEQ